MFEIEACDRKNEAVVEQPSWNSHRGTAIVEQPPWNGFLSEIGPPKRSIF
jgi:hypothetical protein